jgi:heme/copper-type cytochrome/quinol oxidase subunit 3
VSAIGAVSGDFRPVQSTRRRQPKIPSAILGMSIFIVTEIMFFTALISSYLVIKASHPNWAPPADIVLPVYTTLFNTVVLIASGIAIVVAGQRLRKDMSSTAGQTWTLWSIALGVFFVAFQGYEWFGLVRYGMTLKSDLFSSCFYLIIGCHALHAIASVVAMMLMYANLARRRLSLDTFRAMQILWVFVVSIWPVLYYLVYFPG